MPKLIEALREDNSLLRSQAVLALVGIGPAAKSAVPALIDLLKDKSENDRRSILLAFSKMGAEAAAAVGDPFTTRRFAVPT